MKPVLFTIITLFLLNYAYSFTLRDPLTLPLTRTSAGYTVNAVITNSSTNYSTTVPMLVDLNSDYTVFGSSCLGFTNYDCEHFSCLPYGNEINTSNLYASIESRSIPVQLHLNTPFFGSIDAALLAYNCSADNKTYGEGTYGWIGFGFQQEGIPTAGASPAIYLNKNNSHGKLMFYFDQKYTNSSTPFLVLYPNADWYCDGNNFLYFNNRVFASISSIGFDINADALELGASVFSGFMLIFENNHFNCTSDTDRPTCQYNGKIKDLPTFYVTNFNFSLPIPPQVYVLNGANDNVVVTEITLNIRQHDQWSGIILGSDFMKDYYMVFDSQNVNAPTITMYYASHGIQDTEYIEESYEEKVYNIKARTHTRAHNLLEVINEASGSLLNNYNRHNL